LHPVLINELITMPRAHDLDVRYLGTKHEEQKYESTITIKQINNV